ncbi:Kynurenine formamidase [bioreactor metagenome]|uniref:Kynurenine formamidase n=1 Tax=bioreactor metagenome TaxID=1076179 RepID=A0A645DK50_9ZZZZ
MKGKCTITIEIANELVSQGVWLLGVETNTVGTTEDEEIIHKILLSNEIVIIENLDLSNVTDGDYFLSAAPLKISGSDGSPCRALLWQED